MRSVLLAAAAYNWAETHRMASIAKELKNRGWKVYTLGYGRYEKLLEEDMTRVELPNDAKWYTEERIYKLMHMDDVGNDYCSEEELKRIVEEEVHLLETLKPDLVITGYRTTLKLSCQIAKVPLVWVLSAVISPMYYRQGLASMPSRSPLNFIKNIKDKKLQNAYYSKMALKNAGTSYTWNKVAKMYNLPPLKSDLEIFEGDFNLMSDAPLLFPELSDLPNTYRFCGPLLNTKEIEWPECIKSYKDTGRIKIFVTMGSSGEQEILLHILNLLKEVDADIFVATTSIFKESDSIHFPKNFYFAEAFPHIEMAKWVDLSIIHGGQGTVYATILGGKPYIGIPMFSEQEYNLQNLEKFKCGITLSVSELELLVKNIEMLLENKQFEANMNELREKMIPYCASEEASKRAVDEILKFMGDWT